jgi:hypothetical protein
MTDRDKDPDATPQMDKFDEWESDGVLNEYAEPDQSVPAGMRQKLSDQASEIAALKQQLSEREGENRATTMSHASNVSG